MNSISRCLLVALVVSTLTVGTAASQVPAPPQVGASSYLVLDFHSGYHLAAKEPDMRVEPASITKLMTSYVVFRELAAGELGLDEMVRISENAWRTEGSRMFVEVGTEVSVEDLLKGVIIQSGNDASVALAEHVAGAESIFAQMMNAEAARLGMTNTNYTNATGLPDPDHYTTAADVALLSQALIRDFPDYYGWYSDREFTWNDITQRNRNLLLWRDPSVDGLKTGHTEAAGYCLATSAERDGMRLVSVVMGTDSEDARASANQALINYGFRFFETFRLYSAGEIITTAEIWKGAVDEMSLAIEDDLFISIPRGRQDDLEAALELPTPAIAPFSAGESFGTLNVLFDGELRISEPLRITTDIPAAGWWGRTSDSVSMWFGGLFGDD